MPDALDNPAPLSTAMFLAAAANVCALAISEEGICMRGIGNRLLFA